MPTTFDVTTFSSVMDAITACASTHGGTVVFPKGTYESATIHLPSNIHLLFEEGAVLKAAETGFDEPEHNSWDAYQDFGHSHFDNGLLVARNQENISISGNGLITGDGRMRSGDDAHSGFGGKLLVFKECRNVSISDIRLTQGGHFTLLANDVNGLILSKVHIEGQRDGANLIGCKNAVIKDSYFSGHDDGLAFKSDYSLGRPVDTENVLVSNCTMRSNCNAIQFGTETVGAFRNMRFENIRCIRAMKAAIGILSCDGAVIEDISFENVTLDECTTFFFIKIADRGRRPGYRRFEDTGSIRRISFTNVEGKGPMRCRDMSVTPTIMGLPHRPITDLTFTKVHLTVPGGRSVDAAASYVDDTGFFMSRFRTDIHPSYGWWMRDVKNIYFNDCSVTFTEPDGRPAVVVEDGQDVNFSNFTARRSNAMDHDIRYAGNSSGDVMASPDIVAIGPETPANHDFDRVHNLFKDYRAQKVEFSQAPFWFWNDDLNFNEITRQMVDFKSHGVHGFVIHPRAGLPRHLGWMSDGLLDMMRYTIDQAVSRDMWVILYDEGMYPSGSSAGQVVAEDPAYACRGLVQIDLTTATPGDIVQNVKISETGIALAGDQTLVAEVTRQHDGHRLAIVDLPIGSCVRGIHFVDDDPPRRDDCKEVRENLPPAGDLLNPDAMQCFIRLVYQRYYDEFGEHFGRTIKAIFTDEPAVMGRGHFPGLQPRPGTTGILEHVNAFLGYDFTSHLPALWDDAEPDAAKYRQDYNRAIHCRLQETYYKPISDWCTSHGIALTGHPGESDDIGLLRYFQIPGQDVVLRYIEPGKTSALEGAHSTMAKCASSAMLHMGRRRNLNEFAGAYGHELTFSDYRWIALWLLVRGCNMLVPHAFYYSTRGPRIDERPRDVGPNSPWWDDYNVFAEMTGKLCCLNTDSTHLCDVAILGQENRLPWKSAKVCFESQIDFNYLEEHYLLENAIIADDGITVRNMHYKLLIVEEGFDTTLGPVAEAVLNRLDAAGRLISCHWRHGAPDLLTSIQKSITSPVGLTPSHKGIRIRRLRKNGNTYLIIFNESDDAFEGTIQVEGMSSGTLVEMDTGEPVQWSSGTDMNLEPRACYCLIWQDDT